MSRLLQRLVYWNEYKIKVRIKIRPMNTYIFSNQFCWSQSIVCFSYTNQFASAKRFNAQKYYQKELLIIIMSSSMERNFVIKHLIKI